MLVAHNYCCSPVLSSPPQLTLVAIDNWSTSDSYTITVDGVVVGTYDKSSGSSGVTSLGGGCGAPQNPRGMAANAGEDVQRVVDVTLPHSSSTATITITCALGSDQLTAALGIDTVSVLVSSGVCLSPTPTTSPTPTVTPTESVSRTPSQTVPSPSASPSPSGCPLLFPSPAFVDDFSTGAQGWSGVDAGTCGATPVLGGFAAFGTSDVATKTYTGLGAHSMLRVEVTVLTIDSWEPGDRFAIRIDGAPVGTFAVSDTSGTSPAVVGSVWSGDACGSPVNPRGLPAGYGTDTSRSLRFDVVHTAASVSVQVVSSLDESPVDESLGVARVAVALGTGACVTPSPSVSPSWTSSPSVTPSVSASPSTTPSPSLTPST